MPTNSYSTGDGCPNAKARLGPFTPAKAVAHLSIPVLRLVRDDPPRPRVDVPKPPKGSVMRVTEVEGALFRRRNGRTERIRFGDWLKPGDIITVSNGGRASVEMITGGRIGVMGDRAVLILSDSQVGTSPKDPSWKRPLQKTVAAWKKVSERKQPLEVETAGGVMGIKG